MNNRFAHTRRSPGRDFTVSLGAAAEEHRSKAIDDASALLAELGKAPRWGD